MAEEIEEGGSGGNDEGVIVIGTLPAAQFLKAALLSSVSRVFTQRPQQRLQ